MPPRIVSILGLLQVVCVVLGFFALGLILKLQGYNDQNPLVRWSRLAVFLREYGAVLLLLPLLWVISATMGERAGRLSGRAIIVSGIAISGAVLLAYLYAMLFPFSRVALI